MARPFLISWTVPRDRPDRKIVLEWVRDEWERYADDKNSTVEQLATKEAWVRDTGIADGSQWFGVIFQYLHRAELFGIDTPKGRQQMMKACTTILDMAAAVVRVHGRPAEPGEAS